MKGRVTHLLMKRALHSSSKLPPFRRTTSSTRAHSHIHTHTNNSVPFTSPSERGINEWSDRHGEPMGPLPREGKTHSAVLILKQQPSPFACSIFPPPRSPHPLATSFLSSHPHISRPLLNFLVLHLFSSATPYSSLGFFSPLLLFRCLIAQLLFGVCSRSS